MRRLIPLLIAISSACRSAPVVPPEDLGRTRKVHELVEVEGSRPLYVQDYGLVSGLDGTGDAVPAEILPWAVRIFPLDIALAMAAESRLAIVRVEAKLPGGLEAGARVDVSVSAQKEADSLKGGVLHSTVLEEFVVAEGPIVPDDFPTSGRISRGGRALRGYGSPLVSLDAEGRPCIILSLNASDCIAAGTIVRRINRVLGAPARVRDDRKIEITMPDRSPDPVAFIASVLEVDVPADGLYGEPTVWVNAYTQSIGWEGGARVRAGSIKLNNGPFVTCKEGAPLEDVIAQLGREADFSDVSDLLGALFQAKMLEVKFYSK